MKTKILRNSKINLLFLVVLFIALLFTTNINAADRYSVATGNWNQNSTWSATSGGPSGATFPVAGDNVFIENGKTITVTANAACTSITFNETSVTSTSCSITISLSFTLSVSGLITMTAPTAASTSTLAVNAGMLNAADISIVGGGGSGKTNQITVSTGTITVTGNITFSGDAIRAQLTFTDAGTLNIGGNCSSGGTFTASSSNVYYNKSGAQTVGPYTYNNLSLSGIGASNTKTMTNVGTINGNFSMSGSADATVGVGSALYVGGNVSLSGSSILTMKDGGSGATIHTNLEVGDGTTFTASDKDLLVTGTTTVGAVGGTSGTLTISSATGSKDFIGNITINTGGKWDNTANRAMTFPGNLTVNGTFNAGTGVQTFSGTGKTISGTLTIPSVTITGTYTNNGNLTVSTALAGAGGLTQASGATLNIGGTSGITTLDASTNCTNLVNYSGGAQTVKGISYCDLTLSVTSAKTIPAATSITVNGILSMEGTATLTLGGTPPTGVLNYGSGGTLKYNTTHTAGPEWVTPFSTGGGVIINGGIVTLGVSTPKEFNSTLTIKTGATLISSNNQLTFSGNFVNDGTFTAGNSPIIITGTAGQAPAKQNIAGFNTGGSVSMFKSAGTAYFTGNVSAVGLVIQGSGTGNLNLGAGLTHTFTGNWTRTGGTLDGGSSLLKIGGSVSGTGGIFNAGTGTVEWNAAGAQTIATVTYNNLTLSGGSGIKTFSSGTTTVNGILNINTGVTATIFTGTNDPVNNLILGGTNEPSGTWGGTTSGASHINTTFFNPSTGYLTVAYSITSPSDYFQSQATGNWSTLSTWQSSPEGSTWGNASLAPTNAATLITLQSPNNVTMNVNNQTASSIVIESGSTLTNSGSNNLNVSGDWTNNGGTFTPNTGTITFNGTGAQTINGTVANKIYNNVILSKTGLTTLNTSGGTTALTVNNLTETTGNFTAPATLNVSGTLTLTAGTFTAGTSTNIGGNFSNNGGTFTANTGTVTFNGVTQAIGGSAGTTFNNLTLSNSGLKTFTNTKTVNGILSMEGTAIASAAPTYGPAATLQYNTPTSRFAGVEWVSPFAATGGVKIINTATITLDGDYVLNSGVPLYIDNGAHLAINTTKSLTVGGNTTLNGAGTLLIKSDLSGTGSLITNGTLTSVGTNTATVERYFTGASTAWHFLSSPVAAQAIQPEFVPSQVPTPTTTEDFYAWYEPTSIWVNFKNTSLAPTWNTANGNTDFTPGRGYLVEYLATTPTKQFQGNLNNGSVSYTMSKTGLGTYSGYNLAGNPYPSAIDWKASSGWDRSNLENVSGYDMSIWIDGEGNYGSYNSEGFSGTGANGISQYIPVGQGFMVKAASAGTLGMDNGIRVHNSQAWLKSTNEIPNILRMKVTGEATTYSDEIVIEFGHPTDNGGAGKMFSLYETAPSLYTVKPDGKYSVDFRGEPGAVVIPVSFNAGIDGNYALTASQLESFTASTVITLEDVKANKTQNLMENPVYRFTSGKTDEGARFFLHFGGTFGVNDKDKAQPVNIYASGNSVYISNKSGAMLKGEVIVYNIIGQPVMRQRLSENPLTQINLSGRTGYYLVKVVTNINAFTSKVFINN